MNSHPRRDSCVWQHPVLHSTQPTLRLQIGALLRASWLGPPLDPLRLRAPEFPFPRWRLAFLTSLRPPRSIRQDVLVPRSTFPRGSRAQRFAEWRAPEHALLHRVLV